MLCVALRFSVSCRGARSCPAKQTSSELHPIGTLSDEIFAEATQRRVGCAHIRSFCPIGRMDIEDWNSSKLCNEEEATKPG